MEVILTMRTDEISHKPPNGSAVEECDNCNNDCFVAPSSYKAIGMTKAMHGKYNVICKTCFTELVGGDF